MLSWIYYKVPDFYIDKSGLSFGTILIVLCLKERKGKKYIKKIQAAFEAYISYSHISFVSQQNG